MSGWSEDILGLCFARQLLRENLALNVGVGPDVRDRQSDAFAHDLGVQILTLDLFLHLSAHKLDWVRVRPVGRLVSLALHVAFIVDKMVIVDNYG